MVLGDIALKAAFRLYCRLKITDPRNRRRNAPYSGTPDGLPVPPLSLVFAVAGTPHLASFLDGGQKAAASIRSALATQGVAVESLLPLLDFGCG
jgi:hypothetical protein